MQDFTITDIRAFAEITRDLYRSFFSRYPFLKPILLKALFYDNGNYGLIVTENKLVKAKYTIYKSSEGFIVERNINNSIQLKFQIDTSVIQNLIRNKSAYLDKPYKLFKYFPILMHSISINSDGTNETILEGNKVYLRAYEESDIPYLLDWYNDYELNKLAGWSSSKVNAAKLKYNMSRSFGSDPMNLMIDDINGKPIGTIQLYDFNDHDKSCKLGIRIGDKAYWSRGYGRDAVNTIVEYAFMNLSINRVDLRVYEYNERAARCYEKCGFKLEGRSRKSAFIDGDYYDELLMGLLKSEFLNNKP